MRAAPLLCLFLVLPVMGLAQSLVPPTPQPPAQSSSSAAGAIEKRTERIRHEDGSARIDELRVGGETQSITVQPKNRMPAYQIAPTSGERSWKVLSF